MFKKNELFFFYNCFIVICNNLEKFMNPHVFTPLEGNQFNRLLNNLCRLGEKGFERIEIIQSGNDYIPSVIKAPNWFGRIIERIFGKKDSLKYENVASFVNAFIIANKNNFQKVDSFKAHKALEKISHRFQKSGRVCSTANFFLRVFEIHNVLKVIEKNNILLVIEDLRERISTLELECIDIEKQLNDKKKELATIHEKCASIYAHHQEKTDRACEEKLIAAERKANLIVADAKKLASYHRTLSIANPPPKFAFADILADDSQKDLAIVCKDGQIVLVHSLFFTGLHYFQNGTRNKSKDPNNFLKCADGISRRVVDLSDYSKPIVEFLVKYCYAIESHTQIPEAYLFELLSLSGFLLDRDATATNTASRLFTECESLILKFISNSDWTLLFECVDFPFSFKIQQTVLNLMIENFEDIANHPSFLELSKETLIHLLKHKDFSFSGLKLLPIVIKWASYQTNNSEKLTFDLLNEPVSESDPYSILDYIPFEDFTKEEFQFNLKLLVSIMKSKKLLAWLHWFNNSIPFTDLKIPRQLKNLIIPSYINHLSPERQKKEIANLTFYDNVLGYTHGYLLLVSKKFLDSRSTVQSKPWGIFSNELQIVFELVWNKRENQWDLFLKSFGKNKKISEFFKNDSWWERFTVPHIEIFKSLFRENVPTFSIKRASLDLEKLINQSPFDLDNFNIHIRSFSHQEIAKDSFYISISEIKRS